MKFGVDKKVNLLSAGIILVLGLVLGFYFVRQQSFSLNLGLCERATVIINDFVLDSEYPLLVGDHGEIVRQARAVLALKDVVYCRIQDKSGEILYEAGEIRGPFREFSAVIGSSIPVEKPAEELLLGDNSPKGKNETIGKAYLLFSLTELDRKIHHTKIAVGITVIIAIILASYANFVFNRIVLGRPVSQLVKATERLAAGDLNYKVSIETKDEIGELAASFNKMTDDLLKTTVSRDYVDNILNNMMDSLVVVTETGKIRTTNQAILNMLGYEENELIGKPIEMIIDEERDIIGNLIKGDVITDADKTYLTKSGRKISVLFSGSVMRDDDGGILGVVCAAQDITQRKEAEEKLRKTTRALGAIHACNTLLTQTSDERVLLEGVCRNIVEQTGYRLVWVGFVELDEAKRLRPVARAGHAEDYNGTTILSWGTEENGGDPASEAIRTGRPCILDSVATVRDCALWIKEEAISCYGSVIGLPLLEDNTAFGVLLICATDPKAFDDAEVGLLEELAGDLGYGIVALRTREKHRKAEEKLAYQAFHDSLTGLSNRAMIMESLNYALARAKRFAGSVGILFIDLDDFKLVNDTQGHDAGDELLCQVAERLRDSIRETDIVARQGGDEFIVLLDNHDTNGAETEKRFCEQTADLAKRIINMMKHPFRIQGQDSYIGASIGISLFPDDAENANTLLQHADSAMYRAKELGKGNYQLYSIELSERQHKRHSLITRLHRAIEQQEFALFYQPFVDLASGQMSGAEALIRWREKEGNLISPADFLPVAEDTGLIIPIGEWVLADACRQIRKLQDKGLELKVAVNLSVRQFWQGDIASRVLDAMNRFGIRHDALELEITESAMSLDPARTETILRRFSDQGLSISLDDFGTGYSSLNRLKQFPINKLKIDKSFVDGIPGAEDDIAIVRAIIQLAHNLGIQSLAEGIETADQWRFLRDLGCRYGQGYHFSRPLPEDEFEAMLERNQCWSPEP